MAKVTAELLAACLADVESGRLSIDQCVAQNPAAGDELRALLEVAASIAATTPVAPDPAFVARTRASLITAVNSRESGKSRRRGWRLGFVRALGMPASLAAIVLALGLGGAGVAQAAQGALPGDALYAVKTTIEDARLALAIDDEAKARTYLEIAAARLSEVEQARLQGKRGADEAASSALIAVTTNAERHIEKAANAGHDVGVLSARLADHVAREKKALGEEKPPAARTEHKGKGEEKASANAEGPNRAEPARPEGVSAQPPQVVSGTGISATAALTQAISDVQRLASSDNTGQSYRGLLAKLDAADAALRRGQRDVAAHNLDAFADELAAMARSGHLAQADYDALYLRYTTLVTILGRAPKDKARAVQPNGGDATTTPAPRRQDDGGTGRPEPKPTPKETSRGR